MANSIGFPSGSSPSGSVPHVWSKYMAKTYDSATVMAALTNKSVEGDLANFGDTVHVQRWGNVTISPVTVGSDFTVQSVSLTDATLVLNQIEGFQFVIDNVEKAVSHLDLVKGFSERAMIAMAQTIDTFLFLNYANVQSGNTIGSTSAAITLTQDNVYTYFVQAGLLLDLQNIPKEGRVAVIDPLVSSYIRRSPDYVKNTATGDAVVRNGEIGELAGFKVVESNRITNVSGTYPLMFFHPDFISFAMRISPDRFETYKPEKQFGIGVKGEAFYGSQVFNPKAGVTLYRAV